MASRRAIPQYEEVERKTAIEEQVYDSPNRRATQIPNVTNNVGAIVAQGVGKIALASYEQSKIEESNKAALLYLQKQDELQRNIDENWDGWNTQQHIDEFNRQHDFIDSEVLNSIDNGEVRKLWSQKLKENRAGWQPKVRAQGWMRQKDRGIRVGLETADAWEKKAGNAATDEEFTNAIAEIAGVNKGLAAAGYISDEAAAKDTEARMDRISGIYMKNWTDRYIDNNNTPEGLDNTLDFIATNPVFIEADEKVRRDIIDYAVTKIQKAKNEQEKMSRTEKVIFTQNKANALAQLEQNNKTDINMYAEIRKTFKDPDDVEAETRIYQKEERLHKGMYFVRNEMEDKPKSEVKGFIDGLKNDKYDSDVSSKLAVYAEQLYSARERMLSTDAAEYILSYMPNAAENPDLMLSEQARLGVPAWNRRLLTNSQAENIVNNMSQLRGEEIVAGFDQLQERYSRNFNVVVQDLVRQKMAPALRIVAGMGKDQNPIRTKIAEVYKMKEGDLLESVAGIRNQDKQTIKTAVDIELNKTENMAAIRSALANTYGFTAEGMSEIADIKDVLQRTSYAYMLDGGISATQAAKKVVNEVIHKNYTFSADKNYFIPNNTGISKGLADEATKTIQNNLTTDMLNDTFDDGKPIYRTDKSKERALNNIKKQGYWANTPDKTGLMLLAPSGEIVPGKDKKPIIMTWEAIKAGAWRPPEEPKPTGSTKVRKMTQGGTISKNRQRVYGDN